MTQYIDMNYDPIGISNDSYSQCVKMKKLNADGMTLINRIEHVKYEIAILPILYGVNGINFFIPDLATLYVEYISGVYNQALLCSAGEQ